MIPYKSRAGDRSTIQFLRNFGCFLMRWATNQGLQYRRATVQFLDYFGVLLKEACYCSQLYCIQIVSWFLILWFHKAKLVNTDYIKIIRPQHNSKHQFELLWWCLWFCCLILKALNTGTQNFISRGNCLNTFLIHKFSKIGLLRMLNFNW